MWKKEDSMARLFTGSWCGGLKSDEIGRKFGQEEKGRFSRPRPSIIEDAYCTRIYTRM
jgi:hypothetical protein